MVKMKGKNMHTKIIKNHIGTWGRQRHPGLPEGVSMKIRAEQFETSLYEPCIPWE